ALITLFTPTAKADWAVQIAAVSPGALGVTAEFNPSGSGHGEALYTDRFYLHFTIDSVDVDSDALTGDLRIFLSGTIASLRDVTGDIHLHDDSVFIIADIETGFVFIEFGNDVAFGCVGVVHLQEK